MLTIFLKKDTEKKKKDIITMPKKHSNKMRFSVHSIQVSLSLLLSSVKSMCTFSFETILGACYSLGVPERQAWYQACVKTDHLWVNLREEEEIKK